jgi:hypothetical protein
LNKKGPRVIARSPGFFIGKSDHPLPSRSAGHPAAAAAAAMIARSAFRILEVEVVIICFLLLFLSKHHNH